MKNNILINIIFILFFVKSGFAENISIQSKNITLDKNKETSIFQNEVFITTQDIKHWSDYDYIIINKNLEVCFKQIENIINTQKLTKITYSQIVQ